MVLTVTVAWLNKLLKNSLMMHVAKRFVFSLVLIALLCPFSSRAETITEIPARIPTVTRWITLFYELETSLANALHTDDQAKLNELINSNFELRLVSNPDQAIPLDVWLKTQIKKSSLYSNQIEKMAVHNIHDTAIVSYESTIQSSKNLKKKIFIVDVWSQENNQWKLMTRYSNESKPYHQYLKNNLINKKY